VSHSPSPALPLSRICSRERKIRKESEEKLGGSEYGEEEVCGVDVRRGF